MIYFFRIPPGMGEDYEFDGEHANCCAVCKYNCNTYVETNECGVYYDPPLDCDSKDDCENWYETFIRRISFMRSVTVYRPYTYCFGSKHGC